jgi:hypothetical protein
MSWWSNINWNAVAAIASVIGIIFAFITVWHTLSVWREQEKSNRPYFTIEKPGIKKLPNSPPYRVQITFYNVGKRPAANFEGELQFMKQNSNEKPYQKIDFSVGNDIPINSPTPWYNDNLELSTKMDATYIITKISYVDPISKEKYNQEFYMKWDGVINGTTSPDFTHVSINDKNKIKEILDHQN